MIDEIARQRRISRQAALLAAFAHVIARRGALEQIVIGVDVSLRDVYRVPPDAVGQFTTTLPVVVTTDPRYDLLAGLAAAGDGLMNTLDHRSADADTLIKNLDVARHAGLAGLPQVAFSYEDQPAAPAFAGLHSSWEVLFSGWSLNDLNLQLKGREQDGGLGGRLVYAAAAFDQAAAEEMTADMITLLINLTN